MSLPRQNSQNRKAREKKANIYNKYGFTHVWNLKMETFIIHVILCMHTLDSRKRKHVKHM